jgi:hypothetical protein
MEIPESRVHSFIVKIWLEEMGDEPGTFSYRGYITHVPSGERRYLKRLSDVRDFIENYLEKMGAKRPGFSLRKYLRRLRAH